MIGWLVVLFTVVPALELFLLLQIGSLLGPTATFLLILLTGVVGAWLARREGVGVLMDLRRELDRGLPPGDRLMEGVMVLAGGLLLVTPGVVTDLVGFSLIFPVTRRLLAPRLVRWLTRNVDVQVFGDLGQAEPSAPSERARAREEREAPQVRYRQPLRPPESRESPPRNPFSNKFDDLP